MENENNLDTQSIDVDSLMAEINAPTPDRLQSEPEQASPPVTQEPVQTQEYEFDWNGRKIKAPVEKLTKWASQGYDYSQKMEAFKAQQAELAKTQAAYEKYKTIDEYVKKDPSWWSHVEEQYNNRLASEDPITQRVKGMLEEKLAPFTEILAQKQEQETQAKIQKEDTALAQDIKSIREKYSDLDFDTADADGKSLEHKVIEYAAANSMPSFKAAFLDFYHDQLEKRWEARGREAVAKDVSQRNKLGLSVNAQTPKKKADGEFDVRGKNYNQIYQEILDSL